jgi:hypothetical protein
VREEHDSPLGTAGGRRVGKKKGQAFVHVARHRLASFDLIESEDDRVGRGCRAGDRAKIDNDSAVEQGTALVLGRETRRPIPSAPSPGRTRIIAIFPSKNARRAAQG